MTTAEARNLLERFTQVAQAPVLSTAEVDDLLAMARVKDVAGVVPGATGYVATYVTASLRQVAAEGWRWKAGKAKFDVKAGSTDVKRMQLFEMCLRMAAEQERLIGGIGRGGIGSLAIVSSLAVV